MIQDMVPRRLSLTTGPFPCYARVQLKHYSSLISYLKRFPEKCLRSNNLQLGIKLFGSGRKKILAHSSSAMTGVQGCNIPMLGSQTESRDLYVFYEKIFPSHRLLEWLSGDASTKSRGISRREFSFTLSGGIYTRFLSFNSSEEFSARLVAQLPVKIDIGAVYNARPNERKSLSSNQFRPMEKELVFDIDMTDYDDVRNCCT